MSYPNGDFFIGRFENSEQKGDGEYKYANGIVSKGKWVTGLMNGQHVETHPNGKIYIVKYIMGHASQKEEALEIPHSKYS